MENNYHYLLIYSYHTAKNSGLGNVSVSLNKPVHKHTGEELQEIGNAVAEKFNLDKVIVLNFIETAAPLEEKENAS